MKKPLISIITACFNNENTINDTIESILNQTYTNLAYILVDGSSSDSTVSIIKSYERKFQEKKIQYKWISEPDNGIYDAWNKGLERATGDWIVFIGGDDYFKSNSSIQETVPFLNRYRESNCNFFYGKIEHINKNGGLVEISGKPWQNQKNKFKKMMNIGHSGSFHHKSLFSIHGNFDSTFQIAGDFEFLLREFKNQANNAYFVNKILIVMREGGISATLSNRLVLIKESRKARKLNGLTNFSKELFFWELKVRVILLLKFFFGQYFASLIADYYRKIFLGKQKRWNV